MSEAVNKDIADLLKGVPLTRSELCRLLGVSRRTLNRQIASPTLPLLWQWAIEGIKMDAYSIPVEDGDGNYIDRAATMLARISQ